MEHVEIAELLKVTFGQIQDMENNSAADCSILLQFGTDAADALTEMFKVKGSVFTNRQNIRTIGYRPTKPESPNPKALCQNFDGKLENNIFCACAVQNWQI